MDRLAITQEREIMSKQRLDFLFQERRLKSKDTIGYNPREKNG